MAHLQKEVVTFRAAGWSDLVARDLQTIGDMTAPDLAIFETEISAGRWQVLDVLVHGERRGCVVHSVEQEGPRHSLIINAAAVQAVAGVSVTDVLHRLYLGLAKQTGAYAIRFWTKRQGLVKKMERVGYVRRYVMELEIDA